MKRIDILYQFNEKYVPYAGTSLTSLFENNRQVEEIRVFLLGEELLPESIQKLKSLGGQYHREISFIDTIPVIEEMRRMNMPSYRGSYAANIRLFLSSLLPEDVDRLLYLDADTIVNTSLEELFSLDMGDYPVGMALDSLVRKHKLRLGFDKKDYYYNSGVILFQMNEWKKRKCSERIAEHIKHVRAHYPSPDQDLLNVVCKGEIFTLHPRYNLQPIHLAFSLSDYYHHFCRTGYYPVDTVRNAVTSPAILHFFRFVGEFPWDRDNVHPDREAFERYLVMSPWKDYQKQPAHNGWILKIEKIMYRMMPRGLFIIAFKAAYEYFIYRANLDSLRDKINKTM